MAMDIFATIGTVSAVKQEMEELAGEIQDCNEVINATLEELESESFGRFVDDLKVAADNLIDFAASLVKALFSGIKVIGEIAEKLTASDEEGANSLSASGIYGRR